MNVVIKSWRIDFLAFGSLKCELCDGLHEELVEGEGVEFVIATGFKLLTEEVGNISCVFLS